MLPLKRTLCLIAIAVFSVTAGAQTGYDPPEIKATGDQYYCPQSSIKVVESFEISGADASDIDELSIQISSGYANGDLLQLVGNNMGISSSWNPATGKLTLHKNGGFLDYQEIIDAVNNVIYTGSDPDFNGEKYFSFTLGNKNFLPSTGHFYEYVSDPQVSWTMARTLAENKTYFGLQGYLATITSGEEAQLTGEQAEGTGWIGASDKDQEGTWQWVTGPEAGDVFWIGDSGGYAPNGAFEFWNTGEPNNLGEEDYAHVTAPTVGVRGSWNDLPNQGSTGDYEPKGYLVEYGYGGPEDAPDFSAYTRIYTSRIDSVFSGSRCGPGIVELRATVNHYENQPEASEIFWFENETSTSPVWTGNTFEPDLSSSATYYVLASQPGCSKGERHEVQAEVFSVPKVTTEVTIKNCDQDEDPNDGFTDFNLNEAIDLILINIGAKPTNSTSAKLPPPIYNVSYHLSENEAILSLNPLDPYPFNNRTADYVYARVESVHLCYAVSKVNLQVSATEPVEKVILESCDMDEVNDGHFSFDLTLATEMILAQLPPQNLRVQYYHTLDDAALEQNEIQDQSSYLNQDPFFQSLFVRIESEENGDCISLGEFLELYVFELPEFKVPSNAVYCENLGPFEMSIYDPQGNYSYEWKDPAGASISNDPAVMITMEGQYTVTATSNLNCRSKVRTVDVRASSIAAINKDDILVTDGGEQNSISIDTENLGIGVYEYALDNPFGPYQEEPFFNDVPPGIHTVYIRDQNGCGTAEIQVSVIGYPKFFTPNGDGYNDTWQVQGVSFQPQSDICIYDKFGKLLARLDGNDEGWNGLYNGQQLPSSDYWYRVQLEDGRIHTGHFSLIRR